MKPIKLTIEGINSFIEPQTLDFEAVGRTNLFCISGKTGAGKTTIFDSIMLALYGKSGKGNLADVVNLSRMSARVSFEFSANGEIYVAERNIKCRYEKNSDGTQSDKRVAVCDSALYKNGIALYKGDAATDYIRELIGLDAGEFKSVYLLEQGEYAEFLKKTPLRQTEAVGKIFDLMRFGDVCSAANDRVRELEKTTHAKRQTILDLSKKYGLIEQTLFDGIEDEGLSSRTALDCRDELSSRLTAEHKSLATLKAKTTALQKDAEAFRAELSALEKERELFISVTEKQRAVKNLMLSLDENKKKAADARDALESFEKARDNTNAERLEELKRRLTELNALSALDREYSAAADGLAAKRKALEIKRREAQTAAARVAELEKSKADASAAFEAKLGEAAAAVTDGAQISDKVKAACAGLNASVGKLNAVADALHALEDGIKEYNGLKNNLASLEKKRAELLSTQKELLDKIERYGVSLEEMEKRLDKAKRAEQAAAEALNAARLNSHASAVRAELKHGDRCPVCGGVYDGSGDCSADTDISMRKAEHDAALSALEKATAEKAECVKHADMAKKDFTLLAERIDECEKSIADTGAQAAALHVDPEQYARLTEMLTAAKKPGGEAERAQTELFKFGPEATRINAELDAATAAVTESEKKAEELKAKLGDGCGKTVELIKAVKDEIAELEKKEKAVEDSRKKLENELNGATGAVSAVEKSLAAARAECPVDMPPFDEEKYAAARDRAESVNKQIVDNEKAIAVRESELKALEDDCALMGGAVAEYNSVGESVDVYKKIAELTKGKAMLNYVANEYIVEFTAIASEILNDLSSGKYTMSYDKTNGFIVSDYLNGGKSRKTDTLSGGELFLASLSVAIAIARTVSNNKNAFFFLDEGFGTLDDELIDTVYGALESLSKDCLVGVITHAGALIERMPSCVEVAEATDTAGSRIVC